MSERQPQVVIEVWTYSTNTMAYFPSVPISTQDGYWFIEGRRGKEEKQGILTFKEAMDNPEEVTARIGETGCQVIQWLHSNIILNFAFAVNIVHGQQINVVLRPGADISAVGNIMKESIESALERPAILRWRNG